MQKRPKNWFNGVYVKSGIMSFSQRIISLFVCLCIICLDVHAQKTIVVDPSGRGDYRTIQGAIQSLSNSADMLRKIYIKNGVYQEKLYIEKSNLIIEGESMQGVIIRSSIARDAWRCEHTDDWGVATMNIGADDITLIRLTVENRFGFDHTTDIEIPCKSDTISRKKILTKSGHQMALRTLGATRLKAIGCRFAAFGGDTVSPWEVERGCWYFKDCIMEGGVDFYCPRGWAYAENCTFIAHSGTAAIWHDGSAQEDSKSVLVRCKFLGFDGFSLGRYHRDAQFYLIQCEFADNMKDQPIYRVPTQNQIRWGSRIYYYDCHRKAGDYSWFANNISIDRVQALQPAAIFGERWKTNF
jgi:pectinesterase